MGQRLSSVAWIAAAFAFACSQSDDSVLALNLNSAPDVKNVTSIGITVTRQSGSPLSVTIVPPSSDGGPVPSFFQRISLPGWEGALHVHGVASGPDLTQTASDDTDAVVEKGGAVVGYLTLHYPDAGADGGDAAGGDALGDGPTSDAGSQDAAAPISDSPILDSTTDASSD